MYTHPNIPVSAAVLLCVGGTMITDDLARSAGYQTYDELRKLGQCG